jgi:hypothetical protein
MSEITVPLASSAEPSRTRSTHCCRKRAAHGRCSSALAAQLELQAAAERQGADVWRAIAATQGLPHAMREALAECARLEEESAARLDALVAGLAK